MTTSLGRQRGGDLLAHVIALAACRPRLQQVQPVRADHGEEHVRAGQRLLEPEVEALAGQEIVHVHEDVGGAEALRQTVVQPGCFRLRVVAPVIDEDLARHAHPRASREGYIQLCGRCHSKLGSPHAQTAKKSPLTPSLSREGRGNAVAIAAPSLPLPSWERVGVEGEPKAPPTG